MTLLYTILDGFESNCKVTLELTVCEYLDEVGFDKLYSHSKLPFSPII